MEENFFFQNGSISVTQSRYIVESKTFAMRNISSVQIGIIPANRGLGYLLIALGCFLLIFPDARIIGVILIVLGVTYAYLQKDRFTVRISTNAGETDSLMSKDKAFIQKIVDALNEAMIHRG